MASSDVLTAIRLIASIAVLSYASVLDWRTRKVGNVYWIVLSIIGVVLIPAQLLADERPLEYALVLIPILAVLSDVYIEHGEGTKISRTMPIVKYSIAIVSILALGFLWISNGYFQNLLAVPLFMLFVVVMYMMDLIKGGADAKALLALSIVFPSYPVIGSIPLIRADVASAETVFPFAFAVLVIAAVIVALFPIGFAIRNMARREFKFPLGLLGYRLDIAEAKSKHVWLMENVDGGTIVQHTRPRKNEDLGKELELLQVAGLTRVWVTPKIPFIIPIAWSLVFTAIVGNLLFLVLSP